MPTTANEQTLDSQNALNWKIFSDEPISSATTRMENATANQQIVQGLLQENLAANLAFLNFLAPTLPGVFAGNPWQEVNGALWTLKIEVMFYALVPLIVLAWRRLGPAPVLGSLYALSVLYGVLIGLAFESSGRMLWLQLQRQLPGQLTYFLVGAALYAYRDRIGARWSRVLVVGAVCFVTDKLAGSPLARPLLEPLWMGIAVVFAATGLPFLCNFARFGDLSYGLYIVHFPIIQAAVAAGWFAREPWLAFVAVMVLTVAGAFLSWHLVEKPFLARRSHYRLAEQGAG